MRVRRFRIAVDAAREAAAELPPQLTAVAVELEEARGGQRGRGGKSSAVCSRDPEGVLETKWVLMYSILV